VETHPISCAIHLLRALGIAVPIADPQFAKLVVIVVVAHDVLISDIGDAGRGPGDAPTSSRLGQEATVPLRATPPQMAFNRNAALADIGIALDGLLDFLLDSVGRCAGPDPYAVRVPLDTGQPASGLLRALTLILPSVSPSRSTHPFLITTFMLSASSAAGT